MQADHHSQERLAEAQENAWHALNSLYDAIRPLDGSMPDMATIDTVAERCWPILKAALAASRQPVSGGDVEALREAIMEAQADIQTPLGRMRLRGDHAEEADIELLSRALARLHALLAYLGKPMYDPATHPDVPAPPRVPADGEQPAGQHDGNQGLDEWVERAPADGPVSASRPPEEGVSDYKAGELEGFKAGLAKRDEQIKTGTLPAGLGDRQLTAEERHACKIGAEAIRAMGVGVEDEPVDGDHAELIESLQALGRLASGENPE